MRMYGAETDSICWDLNTRWRCDCCGMNRKIRRNHRHTPPLSMRNAMRSAKKSARQAAKKEVDNRQDLG